MKKRPEYCSVSGFLLVPVIQHIKHPNSTVESLILTFAGMIALCGVNNQPVGICCNSLVADLKRSINGLPVAFIVRAVLEQPTLDDAIDFIKSIKHSNIFVNIMNDVVPPLLFQLFSVLMIIGTECKRRGFGKML